MIQFRRTALAFAAALLVAFPVRAGQPASTLSPDQAAAVEKLIHDYLLNNPKVLVEALQHAEDANREQQATLQKQEIAKRRDEIERDPTSPVIGNPKGDVTVVEFFDYRCPYCKATAPLIDALLNEDKGVRFVLKDYPVLGKESVFAARVALVVARHGKIADFYKAMFALKTPVDESSTLGVVKGLGLDPAQVKKESEASDIDVVLKNNYELGQAIGADGTPSYVIGDSIHPGALEADELKAKIAAARTKQPS